MRGLNSDKNKQLMEALGSRFSGLVGNLVLKIKEDRGIVVVCVAPDHVTEVMQYLKESAPEPFDMMMDLTAVDNSGMPEKKARFEVVYLLVSMPSLQRIRVKVSIAEGQKVPSMVPLWIGANWPEREVYDLFGITFENHPLMERIILPDNFRGHPLRKDFPLEGIGEDYLIEDILLPEEKQKMKIGFIENL